MKQVVQLWGWRGLILQQLLCKRPQLPPSKPFETSVSLWGLQTAYSPWPLLIQVCTVPSSLPSRPHPLTHAVSKEPRPSSYSAGVPWCFNYWWLSLFGGDTRDPFEQWDSFLEKKNHSRQGVLRSKVWFDQRPSILLIFNDKVKWGTKRLSSYTFIA